MDPSPYTLEEKYELITRDLEEVASPDELKALLKEKDHVSIYWGTAITGKPHMAYMVPIYKISDFLKAGSKVIILLADMHGFLDNQKSTWKELDHRYTFYKFLITEMLKLINVPVENLIFVKGTDYQTSEKYTLDMYQFSAMVTTENVLKAGSEVVKQSKHPLMSSLLYPILQALDEEYLDVDVQFGGIDQRKIFMFARDWLPRLGYRKRVHLMNTLIPGLTKSGKMSSSEPLSKIDFDDSDETIRSKILQAFCIDGRSESNGLLCLIKNVIFKYLHSNGLKFLVEREIQWGGNIEFDHYQQLEDCFVSTSDNRLSSIDLKNGLIKIIIEMITPLREAIKANADMVNAAYPQNTSLETQNASSSSSSGPVQPSQATIGSLDVRVGKIVHVEKVATADMLYVTKVDLGEDKERTIISGLVKYMQMDDLKDRLVLVVANLEHKTMHGIASQGMFLTASVMNKDGQNEKVLLITVPSDSKIGEKLVFDVAEKADEKLKRKRLERVLNHVKTNENGTVIYTKNETHLVFKTSAGACTSTLKNATVS